MVRFESVKYETIKGTFEKEGCELITTEDEFINNKMSARNKYKIIASCGHIVENCWYHMFKYRETGKICKNCVHKEMSRHNSELNKECEGNSHSLQIEAQSIQLLKKYVNENIELKVSPECCTADIAIKDNNCKDNKWLPIQVKATLEGRHNIYSFGLHRNYNDMIVVFICINEEKFWIVHGNSILNQCKLSICMQKSKYYKYQVNKYSLSKKLLEFYSTLQTDTIENIQTPITREYKIEQEFRKLRENKLNIIQFEYPKVNQCVYDFKINNYKIQEKTAFLKKPNNYYICLLTKNGDLNDYKKAYEIRDNNFYWINLPEQETFYIIPERILVFKKILSYGIYKGKKYLSFCNRNEWLNEYKYSYNKENINEIINDYFKN